MIVLGIIGASLTLAIISAGIGVVGIFTGNDADAPITSNFFLFAIFLVLLAAVIKYVF
jgi:hypothetical protein